MLMCALGELLPQEDVRWTVVSFPTPKPLPSQPLLQACVTGSSSEVFELLKKNRAHLNERDEAKLGPLLTATISQRADILDVLLDYGADLEESDINGTTALHFAIVLGLEEIVTMLVERGASPTNGGGKPPIRSAAVAGHIELASYLMFLGADLFEPYDGSAPIEAALMTDRLEFVQWALQNEADRVKGNEVLCRRIIDISIRYGAVEILKWLTATQFIPIDLRAYLSPDGLETAVQLASFYGGADLLEWMLETLRIPIQFEGQTHLLPLVLAVRRGKHRCVDILLSHAASINYPIINEANEKNETVLMHATILKDALLVQKLLAAGANPRHQSYAGISPLQLAANRGSLDIVKILVEAGATGAVFDSKGRYPLYEAISNGHASVAEYLYFSPHAKSVHLKTPHAAPNQHILLRAAQAGLQLALRIAIDHPELLFTHGDSLVDSVLSQCLVNGHTGLADLLLQFGYSVPQHCDIKTMNLCIVNGHLNSVKYLLSHGRKTLLGTCARGGHKPSSPIVSALSIACSNGRLPIVKYLVEEEGAPVGRFSGTTDPIFFACSFGHAAVAKYLFSKGSSLEFYNELGHLNLLHAASRQGSLDLVEFLLSQSPAYSSYLNATAVDKMTAILFAAEKGHVEVFKRLVAAGADLHAIDQHSRNAASHAARVGNVEILKICHQRGVNFEVEDSRCLAPPLLAILHGHVEAAEFILKTALPKFLTKASNVSQLLDMGIMSGKICAVKFLVEKLHLAVLLGLPGHCPHAATILAREVTPLPPETLIQSLRMPLAVRCAKFGRAEVLEWLYLAGWIPSLTDRWGSYNAPLAHACHAGHLAVVKMLHKLGVDLHSFGSEEPPSLNEKTPLVYAYTSGSLPLIKWMLSKGCQLNSKSGPGKRLKLSQDPTPVNNYLRSIQIPESD